MPVMPVRLLLATLLLSAPLAAAELVVRDLVVGIGLPPANYDFTLTDSNGTRTGSDAFDRVGAVNIGYFRSFAGAGDRSGLVLGARWVVESGEFAGGGVYSGWGPDLLAGWGVALTDRLALVPCVLVAARRNAIGLEANGAIPTLTAAGFGYAYGGQLGLSYAIADRVVVTLEGGWRTGKSSMSGDRDVDLDNSGFTAALSFGWRFASTPQPLE
jgi:hypothetical protein